MEKSENLCFPGLNSVWKSYKKVEKTEAKDMPKILLQIYKCQVSSCSHPLPLANVTVWILQCTRAISVCKWGPIRLYYIFRVIWVGLLFHLTRFFCSDSVILHIHISSRLCFTWKFDKQTTSACKWPLRTLNGTALILWFWNIVKKWNHMLRYVDFSNPFPSDRVVTFYSYRTPAPPYSFTAEPADVPGG